MQTLSYFVNEAESIESPTPMLKTLSSENKSHPDQNLNRKSTLSIVNLRAPNKRVCVNWSIIPQNASKKQLQDLTNSLEQRINESIDQPIEVLEDKLFYLCYIYYVELGGIPPVSEIVELFHLINVIQEENTKSQVMSNALIELRKSSEDYLKSYEFLCNFMKLVNDLALIYGVINLYDYRYRFKPRIETIKFLNLQGVFSDIINMEILWLSFAALNPPLVHVFSQEVKDLAKLLQDEFYKILSVFMESNKNNLQSKESIQSWLASKNLRLVEEYGFHVETSRDKPAYQSLAQKVCSCFRFRIGFRAAELKQQLFEFEKIYQSFEAAILKSWYDLVKYSN